MDNIIKAFEPKPEEDLRLINELSKGDLAWEDVYVCRIVLCDNEIDRDGEQFSPEVLEQLSALFIGKPGIFDHDWSAKNQKARIYRTQVVSTGRTNSVGEPLLELQADVYLLRTGNDRLIREIEGGILREVSVGFRAERPICSVCGAKQYECEHLKGRDYGGITCRFIYKNAVDAFEFSFVAVPAQKGAGVRKGFHPAEGEDPLLACIKAVENGSCDGRKELSALHRAIREATARAEARKQILAENQKYLRRQEPEESDQPP